MYTLLLDQLSLKVAPCLKINSALRSGHSHKHYTNIHLTRSRVKTIIMLGSRVKTIIMLGSRVKTIIMLGSRVKTIIMLGSRVKTIC